MINVLLWALFIFCLRVAGVAMGTLRMIWTVKGLRIQAALIGLIEMAVFVCALGWVIQDLTKIWNVVAYCVGFGVGTLVGAVIEEQMALGFAVVRITSAADKDSLCDALRGKGYGVTVETGEGKSGKVGIFTVVARRRDVANVTSLVAKQDPHAFITIQEARSVARGYFKKGA